MSVAAPASKHIVVKFCRQYASDIHIAVAATGCAPAVHASLVLPGWRVVVMDRLDPTQGCRLCDLQCSGMTAADAKALKASVLQAYSRAFVGDEGGRWVHGNARGPNIFVRLASTASNAVAATTTADTAAHASDCAVDTSAAAPTDAAAASPALPADSAGTDVMFIDFEFAGREGVARYPFDLDHRSFEPVTALLTMRRHAPAAGKRNRSWAASPSCRRMTRRASRGRSLPITSGRKSISG